MAWWNSKGESNVTNPDLTLRKMMFFTVPATPSMRHFPWLFSLWFHVSSTPSKRSFVKRRNTKRERNYAKHPSLQTMILSYLATLICSAFSTTSFKHVNAVALLCSLLLLTTTVESFFRPPLSSDFL